MAPSGPNWRLRWPPSTTRRCGWRRAGRPSSTVTARTRRRHACGPVPTWWRGARRREQEDVDSLVARLASLEERNAAAAVRADLQSSAAADLETATAGFEAALAGRTTELEEAAGAAEAAQRAADEAEQARHRTAARAEALDARPRRDERGGRARTAARGGRRRRVAARPGRDRRGVGRRVRGGGGRGGGHGRRGRPTFGPAGPDHATRSGGHGCRAGAENGPPGCGHGSARREQRRAAAPARARPSRRSRGRVGARRARRAGRRASTAGRRRSTCRWPTTTWSS